MIALFDKLILVHKPGIFIVSFVVLSCKICKSSVFLHTSSELKDGGFSFFLLCLELVIEISLVFVSEVCTGKLLGRVSQLQFEGPSQQIPHF